VSGPAAIALTVGLVTRHFQNRAGGWDPAMLDIAQDHALCHLHEQGLFELGLVFKGGTALRKCRAGPAGRFSTDLDFAAAEQGLAGLVLATLDGHSCHGFTFTLTGVDPVAGRADLAVGAPLTRRPPHQPGRIGIGSKVELSSRRPWQAPDLLPLLPSGVHLALGHDVVQLPVMTVAESIAEKLARYARVPLARDLYDLCWYGRGALEEPAVRRMWLQKVYGDVVVDDRWNKPFQPADILLPRAPSSIDAESIGFLTQPSDIAGWEHEFRSRYKFLGNLDAEDQKWAAGSPRDRFAYDQLTTRP
jgi:predicted nucleotidyltransferase component of viral defense system